MTLKEIKKWRRGNTYIHTTELAPMFDWLIAEADSLTKKCKDISDEYQQELIDTAKEMMHDTAQDCAEMAEVFDHDRCFWITDGADAIRKKYGVER